MVDKIVNNVSNLDNRVNKNSTRSNAKETIANVNLEDNISESIQTNKKAVSELASSAPVDTDSVAKIKQAIS